MKQQRILLLGGSGFIGKRVAALLRQEGHQVATPGHRELDLQHLHEAQAMPLLADKDVVVNCIGVMSCHADILETIHHHAPGEGWQRAHEAVEGGDHAPTVGRCRGAVVRASTPGRRDSPNVSRSAGVRRGTVPEATV